MVDTLPIKPVQLTWGPLQKSLKANMLCEGGWGSNANMPT